MIKIITFIKGFVRVSVSGKFVERFLNICMNRDIYVWNIKNRGTELLHLNMTIKGFKQIRPVAFKSKTRVKIISRHGFPFIINRYKKRKAFVISAILTVFLLLYITSFVWVIDVEGNEKVKTEIILNELKNNGFSVGTLRYGKNISELQNKMMLSVDELSWIWVEIKGTRAIVAVKEKTPVPILVDRHHPCNIVASNDGVITEINATYGEKVASIGDVVKKGDLLISGVSNTKYDGIHYLHSSGIIKARTYHSKSAEIPLKRTNFTKTGEKISKRSFNFFGFRVKLYRSENPPFEYAENDSKVHHLSLGKNFVMPISFEENIYYELVKEEIKVSEEEAISIGEKELFSELDKNLPERATVINKTSEVVSKDDSQISIKVNYECVEEIGVEAPIEVQ